MSRSSSRSRSRSYSPSRPPKTEKSEDEKSTKEPLVKEVPKNVQDENANNEKSIIDTKDRKLQDREVIILNQFSILIFHNWVKPEKFSLFNKEWVFFWPHNIFPQVVA